MKRCAYVCFIFLFAIPVRMSFAKDTVSYDKENAVVKHCNTHGCTKIKSPVSLQEYIDDGYTELSLISIPSGSYILATLGDSLGGNICHISYGFLNGEISLNPVSILPGDKQLCIYKIKENRLVNSYRDGGKWYDELYEYKNKEYHLLAIDECVGCGVVFRTLYSPKVGDYHLWVSDNASFYKRVPLVLVVNKKSFMFYEHDEDAVTYMYLIPGDKVNIIDENDVWVKIRFKNPKVGYLVGWILKENTNYEDIIH